MNNWTPEELVQKLKENPGLSVAGLKEIPLSKVKAEKTINKYHAVRTYSELCQRTFDSKAEARRGEELCLMEKAGQIQSLLYQVTFSLCERPKIGVTIDFSYIENGKGVWEDVKGVLTRDSRTKYAWLEKVQGIHVELIRRER